MHGLLLASQPPSAWELFVQHCLIGLTNGSLFALIALGYTMVYGIIGLINFAHGDLFMLGCFLALSILTALGLPSGYAISPPAIQDEATFLRELEATLDDGLRLIQLRLPGVPEIDRFAEQALERCGRYGATLMVKEPELANRLGCGLHLRARDLMTLTERPIAEGALLAASCHDAAEAARAEAIGADFITLSPVLPTASHPDATPLGWQAFSELVEQVNFPVYALGGMDRKERWIAWEHGAQGVAGIGGFWRRLT